MRETSETITVPKKSVNVYCDDCSIETPIGLRNQCELCGKDLCNKCIASHHWEGDDHCCTCKDCETISKEFQPKIDELEEMIYVWERKRNDKCHETFKNRTNEK